MLSFVEPHSKVGRRAFLQIGGLGLGGLTLSGLRRAEAQAPRRSVTDKSVIFLHLHGGPSQIETFDPKMEAPTTIRCVNGEVSTKLPGITFGSAFPRLAALADQLSIVRSYAAGNANHDIKPIVCPETLNANMGSLYARIAGINHPVTGMPTNTAIFPQAVFEKSQPAQEQFGRWSSTGLLGSAYAPFVPGGGGNLQQDMQLTLPRTRLDDRRLLLSELDRVRRQFESQGSPTGLDGFRDQAFQTILGGVAEAFDLSREDPKTLARYDTAPLLTPEAIDPKWNNYKFYVDNGRTLGKLLLLARRLCEAGCGFVTVTTNFVWDNHADVNNVGVEEGMRYCGTPMDHAVSAFIEDCAARGLTDKILLVATGEMGRTPRINSNGGRDHWGSLTPLLLSGGGLQMGKVIGQSTRDAAEPLSEPLGIRHLLSTILHVLLDVGQLRVTQGVPNDLARAVFDGSPIPGLL